ncbi:L,D-transpeptidase family protein [Paracoccus fistulariae]|uniref:Murein L,D-transpeptidase n=1 Tax=Paracoccus fistulariae TaxID=658446 RepID=A0ABY7SHI1_9RHOB|nr:L,D-transpeptidase [Paracoccus fistulariae]MDB6181182.1 L,D-transpeptidase [Paracoccus fistulariae]WCR06466.1 murein L,D-transpeptidase [Paracoccus fistulariae]
MPLRLPRLSTALLLMLAASPAIAQSEAAFTAADIDAAAYDGGDLPPGRSALTAKVQVLLDRSGTSPGVIDGYRGGMSQSAIMAFERRAGLPMDGAMDPHVWNLLQSYASEPITQNYTITAEDAQNLVDAIPTDYAEKAQMSAMGYTSIAEKLGERFHMDDKFIAFLNPGVPIAPGSTIAVTRPASPIRSEVTRIIIDKATRRVAVYNSRGRMIADYPATIGSDATPSPSGNHKVVTVAMNPNYTYNPAKNFKQGDNDKPLIVPPGPNGPVGTVWIDLSQPTYGIHGTPTPSQLFRNQSNGCVRLTNWDAEELARNVRGGVTMVEFLPPGVTIAEATGVTTAPVTTEDLSTSVKTPAAATTEAATSAPTATTTPDADLGYGKQDGGQNPAAEPLREDTTEDAADAQQPQDDPLSSALSDILPEGFVVPLPDDNQ